MQLWSSNQGAGFRDGCFTSIQENKRFIFGLNLRLRLGLRLGLGIRLAYVTGYG